MELLKIVEDMKAAGLKLTVDGTIADFLGVNISKDSSGYIHLTQPQLIDSILKELNLQGANVKCKSTPAASSKLLHSHQDAPVFDGHFHYCCIIGKLNYLEKSTRPDISFATHQCACFSANPRQPHANAVKWLGRYLKATRDQRLILKPDGSSFDVYVDADFAGNWNWDEAAEHSYTARSHHGYFIMHASCPIHWALQLQTEVALSSTESEFIGLSMALHATIPIMETMKELHSFGFNFTSTKSTVHCHVFEDNCSAT